MSRRPILREMNVVLYVAAASSLAGCTVEAEGDAALEPLAATECAADPLEYDIAYSEGSPWFNVATDCGAAPLTACLQTRLDSMNFAYRDTHPGVAPPNPVIYFPDAAAPYLIDATLNVKGIHGVTFVGQSPTGTVLKWNAPPPSAACGPECPQRSMFWINGSDHVHIKRMTLDGAGAASTATSLIRVGFLLDKGHNFQSTGNGFDDLHLMNAEYGIFAGGLTNAGDDHTTVRRVSFAHMTSAGLRTEGFQALNTNIWDSSFSFCDIGVLSHFGNVNVYNSSFRSSTTADVKTTDSDHFTLQGNVSIRSPRFLLAEGGGNWLIQNNKIRVASPTAIHLSHPGSAVVVDNVIQTEAQTTDPNDTRAFFPIVVVKNSNQDVTITEHVNMIITGNWFNHAVDKTLCVIKDGTDYFGINAKDQCEASQEEPLSARPQPGGGYFYGNHFPGRGVVIPAVSPPAPPPAPTAKTASLTVTPRCYDPGTGNPIQPCLVDGAPYDDAMGIQAAIAAADAVVGDTHIVVHLPAGTYQIPRTITVPAGKTFEIFGDGESNTGTVLRWTGSTDDYMFHLYHPSRAAFHDLRIENSAYGGGTSLQGRGIHIDSAADDTGIVYLNAFVAPLVGSALTRPHIATDPVDRTENVGFSFTGLDKLRVWAEQSGVSGGNVAVRVQGGGAGATSMNNVTAVKFFGPVASAIHETQFEVTDHGNLYVNGLAAEGLTHAFQLGSERAPGASGRLTIVNGKEAVTTNNTPVCGVTHPGQIRIDDFQGDVSLFGLNTTAPVSVLTRSAAVAHVLVFGNVYRNHWQWFRRSGMLSSDTAQWNEDGPATPISYVLDPNPVVQGWPTVYSSSWSQTYIDCAGYEANTQNYAGFPDVTPLTQSECDPAHPEVECSKTGFFKVAGATSSSNVRFLNNSMVDPTWLSPHACRDITPPGAPVVTPAIDLALTEVRNAARGSTARPCSPTVTDARFFRIIVGAKFTHNALSIDPY
ncbi:right-handed parallel beta-helix repeat-containing protein [Sorangium sp. So ce131]|uniref:right-handed parallel beta-helix repeat-containing protein n=1 Tax=Sorangium sp. So ce131 TaxID=3133282 RepID=UPI003F631D68